MAWTPPVPSTNFEAVGAYIFAGGFTVGMSEVFHIRGHLEDGMFGVGTFKANFPQIPVWVYPDRWPKERFRGIDVIYGNPPCSPWSPVGRSMRHGRENWRTDPNVDCARHYIEYGLEIQPKIWVMESVPQIQKSEFLLDMAQIWMDNGYAFTLVREDAKFFGLHQQRRRCFMVAHKLDIPWFIPDTIHTPVLGLAGDVLEQVTAVGWFPEVPKQHRHFLSRIKPGRSMREEWNKDHPELANVDGRDVPVVGRPLLMIHRIDPSIPSGTIIGQNVYIHPHEDRFIGHLEAAKLCGYPDGYTWVNGAARGRVTAANDYIAQIAKAVTPNAGRFLALNLGRALEHDIPIDVKCERATFWAPTSRVTDNRLQAFIEPWSVAHKCTIEDYLAEEADMELTKAQVV